jgi:serine protease Do
VTCLLQKSAAWLAIVAISAVRPFMPLPALAGQDGPRTADLIATLQPAVVNISVVRYGKTGPVAGNMASQPTVARHTTQSSGFFIASSGIIVTNRHAIADAGEITVTLHDTTRLNACVLASAAQSDIALLKVNPSRRVATVKFGDSDGIRPGDPVFVIGNPLGHGSTVTAGIVSALGRNSVQSEFGSFFQIDASLNEGNSGGPVFNADGEVVGVATALFTPGSETGSVGLGLAIPGNDASFIADRLLKDGQVQLGWIGAHIQPLSADIAAALKLPAVTGSIITSVEDDSPATRVGMTVGDVILKVGDDDEIEPRTLSHKIASSTIGSVIKLVIWRDGIQHTVPIVIGESPADKAMAKPATPGVCEAARTGRHDLGLVLGPITEDARGMLGLNPHESGVLVTDVVANSVAADHGVAAGSLIVNVHRQSVTSPAEVQSGIDAARAENGSFVLMLVRSSEGLRWMALPLDATLQEKP